MSVLYSRRRRSGRRYLLTYLWSILPLLIVSLMLAASFGTARASGAPENRIEGSVRLNSAAAPTDVALALRSAPGETGEVVECGTTTTTEGGRYDLAVGANCPPETDVVFVLTAVGSASREYTVEGGIQEIDISFDLKPEELATLSAATANQLADESSVVDAVESVANAVESASVSNTSQPLITDRQLFVILVIIIVCTSGLLLVLALDRRREIEAREEDVDDKNSYEYIRRLIEGLVLTEVLVAVIILGVTAKISPEGVVSILAAITGYAIGKANR